jgi:MYXO-CTERM domain-containing protein
MMFVDGVSDVPYTFAQNLTGILTSGFNIGGTNTIEAIVNNTGCGRCGPPDGLSSGNPTDFAMVGTLSYSTGDTSTPEPGSMGLIAAGLALLVGRAVRRRP